MNITFALKPGCFTFHDGILQSGKNVTDDLLAKIWSNTMAAILREEVVDMGYYHNGDDIPTPISPADSLAYKKEELVVINQLASAGPIGGVFIVGGEAFPQLGPWGIGRPLVMPYVHARQEELKILESDYAFAADGLNSQAYDYGISRVTLIAIRLSVGLPAIQQLQKAELVTISGATSVGGTDFNALVAVTEVLGPQAFTYSLGAGAGDKGGGGTVSFGNPTVTADIVSSPFGIVWDGGTGTVTVRLVQVPH
jgi:hypothetical protein